MKDTTSCSSIPSLLFSTLLISGLLGPVPASFAQQPDESVQSRIGHLKRQNTFERLQERRRHAGALNHQAAKPGKEPKVRVLQRELLGRFISDIDFIPDGPLAGHIVMLNGQEVHGVPADAEPDKAIRKLFDLRQQTVGAATGIAYIASERLFAIADVAQLDALLIVDHRGTPHPPRPIQYLDGLVPDLVDGLAYLPSTSARFPDHLLMVTQRLTEDFILLNRIQVIRLDGQVVAEIPVLDSNTIAIGVAFLPPDRLLVTNDLNEIWTLDFDGNPLAPPMATELLPAEGIVGLADGRIVTGEGAQLRFYDAELNRRPQDDQDGGTRIGLLFPMSVAWNSHTHEHLVVAFDESFGNTGNSFLSLQVAAVPLSLDASRPVVDLSGGPFRGPKATYMPDENLIAVGLRKSGSPPPQIAFYDNNGALLELIDASAIGGLGILSRITYIPTTREFAVVELTQRSKLKMLTRTGALVREIDLAPIGINSIFALAYFNPLHPSGGQFLIFAESDRAVITDFGGNLMSEFNFRDELELQTVMGASAITTGPLAGAFAAVESTDSSPLVVFQLK